MAAGFASRIAQGTMLPGARLPSVRECARSHGVSPSTVVAAYDRLQAHGLVQARRGSGFYVRSRPLADTAQRASEPLAQAQPQVQVQVQVPLDATALVRGMLQRRSGPPGPGLGTLPEAWLDAGLIGRALRRAMADPGEALRYGDPGGDPGLRQALVRHLGADLGLRLDARQIVTTAGATHALDLIARTMLAPGDAVLVDDPGWAVEHARLSRMGMRLIALPRGADGPDLAALERLLAQHRPRLYVTVSVLHNPTGNSLSLAAAHQVLKLAESHNLTIVEDDTYAWLAPAHLPRLAALDALQRTIYVSGFSKILAPNWRVGYLAAAPHWVEKLVDTKLLSALTTPALQERAVAWCLERGLLRRHAQRVTARLDAARSRVARLAVEAGCRFVTPPQGLFGWLDTGVDTEPLAQAMAAEGWLIAPGRLFSASARAGTLMRINFASAQDARLWRAFERARDRQKPQRRSG
jgi:DNA-binding transcriptional MocR family regulator